MSVHLPSIHKKKKKSKKHKKDKDKDETREITILKTQTEFNVSKVENTDETINENKQKLGVHAFVVDKNIFENYSAYRLNSNMGIGGGPGPSKKRMGFNREFVDMDEYNYMKYNGLLNPDLNQPSQENTFNAGLADSFHGQSQGNITMMQSQPQQQQQYAYPPYNPSMNYNQFYYENMQNIPVNKSVPSLRQPMMQPQYINNVHNRYQSFNPSPHFFQNNPYQNRVPMLNFNSPQYYSHSTGHSYADLSTTRLPRNQLLPSISQSNPRMTRYASASRGGGGNFGFNRLPETENFVSRQQSLGRNYPMKNPSMF